MEIYNLYDIVRFLRETLIWIFGPEYGMFIFHNSYLVIGLLICIVLALWFLKREL
jgi:hypothetical protein